MDYISIKEAAIKWGVSDRHVRRCCNEGKIKGAIVEDGVWIIPDNASKPAAKSRANVPLKREPTISSLAKRVLYERSKNNHYGVYEYLQVNLAYSSSTLLVWIVPPWTKLLWPTRVLMRSSRTSALLSILWSVLPPSTTSRRLNNF